jgi:hypothetical protein
MFPMKSSDIVNRASIEDITSAIKKVNSTPGLRITTGMQALVRVYQSPRHAISRKALEDEFGAMDLHFGWFCRRVAELLGDRDPSPLALTDDVSGSLVLKPSVVAALEASGLKHPVSKRDQ